MSPIALIVDDEADIRELIALSLDRIGVDTHTAGNLTEAQNLLETYTFDVCLTDMKLPDGNGVEFVKQALKMQPSLPIAVITAHGNMNAAVEAMKNGAFDFVSKPVDINLLRKLVIQATGQKDESVSDVTQLRKPASGHAPFPVQNNALTPDTNASTKTEASQRCPTPRPHQRLLIGEERLVGQSIPMQSLKKLIAKVARSNAPVWITGESGTGKELIARLIHENSTRAGKPFVAINCGAIPTELMESEMFGHTKGSFTGANSNHAGLFSQADGGTLFLDEVAELPLQMQVKLLRAIQERCVRPVGSTDEIPTNVRILSASHVDLNNEVEQGNFRHDLYYRLNVICITAPSLRERISDIPDIVQLVLANMSEENNCHPPYRLSAAAQTHLSELHFPGNVRELENILQRAVALCESNIIEISDLDTGQSLRPAMPLSDTDTPNQPTTSETEKDRIRDALIATRWNRKHAATMLGYTYRQLRYRISQFGLDDDTTS